MRRERFKRRPRKNLSTNARHRGGAVRSSDESPVMYCPPKVGQLNTRLRRSEFDTQSA
ncbi:hypothetical protein ZK67_004130, partial [Salmonella enterica subsp. enterica serovar Oranienburg]|nr:hypothetical protein [Salmonella enterica subsp. enterica serovar Oranienburg]